MCGAVMVCEGVWCSSDGVCRAVMVCWGVLCATVMVYV